MSSLNEYIKSQPQRPMRVWAEAFGVSRPYLYGLMQGERMPSVPVARRIEKETQGAVPVTAWPNIRALMKALDDVPRSAAG